MARPPFPANTKTPIRNEPATSLSISGETHTEKLHCHPLVSFWPLQTNRHPRLQRNRPHDYQLRPVPFPFPLHVFSLVFDFSGSPVNQLQRYCHETTTTKPPTHHHYTTVKPNSNLSSFSFHLPRFPAKPRPTSTPAKKHQSRQEWDRFGQNTPSSATPFSVCHLQLHFG